MHGSNTRLGLWFFGFYLVLYVGFVFVNAFAPQLMEKTPIAGLNAAILYGFGLILAAFVLALLYGVMCKTDASSDDGETPR